MSEHYFSDEHWQAIPGEFDQLELMVRAAKDYVQPTDDLRPKSLEAAQNACRKRRSGRRLVGLALFVIVFATTGLPALLLSAYPGLAVVSASELQRRAERSVVECGTETHWALYEAFFELRSEQSSRLNPSD